MLFRSGPSRPKELLPVAGSPAAGAGPKRRTAACADFRVLVRSGRPAAIAGKRFGAQGGRCTRERRYPFDGRVVNLGSRREDQVSGFGRGSDPSGSGRRLRPSPGFADRQTRLHGRGRVRNGSERRLRPALRSGRVWRRSHDRSQVRGSGRRLHGRKVGSGNGTERRLRPAFQLRTGSDGGFGRGPGPQDQDGGFTAARSGSGNGSGRRLRPALPGPDGFERGFGRGSGPQDQDGGFTAARSGSGNGSGRRLRPALPGPDGFERGFGCGSGPQDQDGGFTAAGPVLKRNRDDGFGRRAGSERVRQRPRGCGRVRGSGRRLHGRKVGSGNGSGRRLRSAFRSGRVWRKASRPETRSAGQDGGFTAAGRIWKVLEAASPPASEPQVKS